MNKKEIPLEILRLFLNRWYSGVQGNIGVEILEETIEDLEEYDCINIKERLLQRLESILEYEKRLKLQNK